MRKYIACIMMVVLLLSACSVKDDVEGDNNSHSVNDMAVDDTPDEIMTPINIDLSAYFGETNGTLFFLTEDNQEYIYNETLANERFSPYSTFKIVSTLIGLEEGIITSKDSKMAYDGSTYWYEPWNDDLNLKQAFQNSCVWYYHQIIYSIPQQTIEEHLKSLNYGNMDISEWEGTGNNPKADLNGFWLGSSLEISAKEQVYVLKSLFDGETIYSAEHINLLYELMDTGENNIYGKTGSSSDKSWYVGFFEYQGETIYFATFIEGQDVKGAKAREIAFDVAKDWDIISSEK